MEADKAFKRRGILSGVVSIVSTVFSIVLKLAVEVCDDYLLKGLIIALLVIGFILLCYCIHDILHLFPKIILGILYIGAVLLFLILGRLVIRKKCEVIPPKSLGLITTINQSNNSTNYDNRKTYNYNKPRQRKLTESDIAALKSYNIPKDGRILVEHLEDRFEDTLLTNQVHNELLKLGYLNVHLAPIRNLSFELNRKRIPF